MSYTCILFPYIKSHFFAIFGILIEDTYEKKGGYSNSI